MIEFSNGQTAFLKWNDAGPKRMFPAEAEGLEVLASAKAVRVPKVYAVGEEGKGHPAFLLMEDVTSPTKNKSGAPLEPMMPALGRRLADLHRTSNKRFGFSSDNFIGPTPQPNTWCNMWIEFFTQYRLLHMTRLLEEAGLADIAFRAAMDQLIKNLSELFSPIALEPASLLHGDLWSGNVIADAEGAPVLIDPAAYFGNREADLAMTELFGGFGSDFRAAYEQAWPLLPGYRDRRDIYNLYHLMNHALLFGGGYLSQAYGIIKTFA